MSGNSLNFLTYSREINPSQTLPFPVNKKIFFFRIKGLTVLHKTEAPKKLQNSGFKISDRKIFSLEEI